MQCQHNPHPTRSLDSDPGYTSRLIIFRLTIAAAATVSARRISFRSTESPNPPIPSHDVGPCLNCGEPDPYPRKIRPRRRASRLAPSIAPVPRLRESRPAASIAPEPRLNERRPAASEQGVSQPPSTARTGIPASITSPPPQTSEALSNANNLRPPRAVSRPAPQTTDAGTGNPTRPFRWGQARER